MSQLFTSLHTHSQINRLHFLQNYRRTEKSDQTVIAHTHIHRY